MGDGARYTRVVPDSHFWTDLEQLLEFFKYQDMSQGFLLTGLENTLENGYELQTLKTVPVLIYPYFIDIYDMIGYVKKGYDKNEFIKILNNTISNGYDLIEMKRIFKIPVGNIPEDEIEDYIRKISKKFKRKLIMERKEVYKNLDTERDYQDLRWSPRREKNQTPDEQKPPSEWLNYIEQHLAKAK